MSLLLADLMLVLRTRSARARLATCSGPSNRLPAVATACFELASSQLPATREHCANFGRSNDPPTLHDLKIDRSHPPVQRQARRGERRNRALAATTQQTALNCSSRSRIRCVRAIQPAARHKACADSWPSCLTPRFEFQRSICVSRLRTSRIRIQRITRVRALEGSLHALEIGEQARDTRRDAV